ncbi:MAG: hypothetical protein WBW73_31485 [Rhodoplanes sp.]
MITALESGVRPWLQPWSAEHAAGRIISRCARTESRIRASTSLCWRHAKLADAGELRLRGNDIRFDSRQPSRLNDQKRSACLKHGTSRSWARREARRRIR